MAANGGNYREKVPHGKRGFTMRVSEIKHEAKIEEWKQNILNCRMSGRTVKQWCAEYGCNKATYYRWEREIFKNTAPATPAIVTRHTAVALPSQPEFAELSIAAPALALPETAQTPRFEPVAMIRIGKIELELSNSVSEDLMRQLKELISLAE